MIMATKLEKVVTYHEGPPPVKSHGPLIMWSCKMKHNYPTKASMTIKCNRMVTYFVGLLPFGLLPITFLHPLVTCYFKILRQTETTISPPSECLWPPNLVG